MKNKIFIILFWIIIILLMIVGVVCEVALASLIIKELMRIFSWLGELTL